MAEVLAAIPAEKKALQEAFAIYVAEVSNPTMALSLETASFMAAWIKVMQPKSILDLGSGFSSYVTRLNRPDTAQRVLSVDDSVHWLEKTRSFTETLSSEGEFLPLSDFVSRDPMKFDLVLHDLGDLSTREATLDLAIETVAPEGALLLDDCHRTPYRDVVKARHRQSERRIVDLRVVTRDSFGRFAWLSLSRH